MVLLYLRLVGTPGYTDWMWSIAESQRMIIQRIHRTIHLGVISGRVDQENFSQVKIVDPAIGGA